MAELVDATDLKSVAEMLVGSSPTGGTFSWCFKIPVGVGTPTLTYCFKLSMFFLLPQRDT